MRPTTLRFTCSIIGKGWVEISLSDGIQETTLTASYLSDAIFDLLTVVVSLMGGAQKGKCAWQQEPGEYRWLFSRQEGQLKIRLLWFKETFSHQSDEEGDCSLILECSLHKLAIKLAKQLEQLLATWGDESYQQTWGYSFPHTELQKLKHLISETL